LGDPGLVYLDQTIEFMWLLLALAIGPVLQMGD
jgi:hypothetical protein